MDSYTWNSFKSGWVPSDDAVNGRKDGYLTGDNLELDKNGALTLVGGTAVIGTAYTYNAHTIFSNTKNGSRHDYVADVNGGIFRNGSSIGTGGDTANAAFGIAFNYVLIASGNTRKKDTGAATVNLGITPSNVALAVVGGGATYTANLNITSTVLVRNISFANTAIFTLTTTGNDNAVIQSYVANGPVDWSTKTTLGTDPARSTDILTGASFGSLKFHNFTTVTSSNPIATVTIDILLEAPGAGGAFVTNYFRAQIDTSDVPYTVKANLFPAFGIPSGPGFDGIPIFGDQGPTNYLFAGGLSSELPINITRNDFIRYGTSSAGWDTVYGVRITVTTNGATSCSLNYPLNFQGGLIGAYQWMQVNVNNNAAYVGKSTSSPVSVVKSLNNEIPLITPSFNVAVDTQINEVWIFRRGGSLDDWYRVKVLTSNFTTNFYDELSDIDALTLGITFDSSLISAASSGITQKIYDIIGPIEGRWMYFTAQFMYPSDINDPDLVNPNLGVRLTVARTGAAEIYLWARRISDNAVMVGTSTDLHILTGTFATLPDGTIDVFYRSLGCANPPVTYDATVANGEVIYLAADGWRSVNGEGTSQLLVAPNTDRLYRGETCSGYGGVASFTVATLRYPVLFAKNKLWCSIAHKARMEVLDSIRNYWHPRAFAAGAPTALCATQDNKILAFFGDSTFGLGDNKLRVIDNQPSKALDGTPGQAVNLTSLVFDGGTPYQRKDISTIKIRVDTGGSNLTVQVVDDAGVTHTIGSINGSGVTEFNLPIYNNIILTKIFQIILSGTLADFTLDDVTLYYQTRPVPLLFLRIYNQNFGNSSKKRLRVWPIVIDTRGGTATFQPYVDNVVGTAVTLSAPTDKTTINAFFKSDVFGIDYGGKITADSSSVPFEFYEMMNPDIVQTLPIARQFDQVGPEELFRYGKIRQFELRCLAFGTAIPWTMYFNDNSTKSGSITTISGFEQSYFIGVPMGAGGQIVRIEFGPTAFDFHRYYVRLQVMKSGRDTENEWVTIPDPNQGE